MSVSNEVLQKLDASFGPTMAAQMAAWFNELDSGTVSTANLSISGDAEVDTNLIIGGGTIIDSVAFAIGGSYSEGGAHERTGAISIGEIALTSNSTDCEMVLIHQYFAGTTMTLYQGASPGAIYACGMVFEGFTVTSTAARSVDICACIYVDAAPTLGGSATAAEGPYSIWVNTGTSKFGGRLLVTDGVTSGTERVVGGRAFASVAAADSVTAAASNNAFVSFSNAYTIPANTLKANTVVKMRALVRVSDASGTDTLTIQFLLGSTSLIATTAVNPGATTDIHIIDFEVTSRAAPSATSSLVGSGHWITNTGGTIAHGTGLLGATNFATNGALSLAVQAKWSSNTANTACLLESFTVEIL